MIGTDFEPGGPDMRWAVLGVGFLIAFSFALVLYDKLS